MSSEIAACSENPGQRLPLGLVWLRRDLRLHDNAALHAALRACDKVALAFEFDRDILDPLLQRGPQADRRVEFILAAVADIDAALRDRGAALIVRHASARGAIPALAAGLGAQAVFCGRDDEPEALARDGTVEHALLQDGRALRTVRERMIFERDEVLTAQGKPYSVFTPYRAAWLAWYAAQPQRPVDSAVTSARLAARPAALRRPLPTLSVLGLRRRICVS